MTTRSIADVRFDNTFTRLLPGDNGLIFDDPSAHRLPGTPPFGRRRQSPGDALDGIVPREVHEACYSRVHPTPVSAPKLIGWSPEVAALLDLPSNEDPARLAAIFSGNTVLPGMAPYSACYGGHQFGNWAGQLGDGRAIALGEIVNSRWERWELQLKGAGPTPYSRRGDGRAVLRSSVREFLCSEAMFHLGVPTTRALSLVTTGDHVVRDMFYDGNAAPEPGAIVCRVAPSFLRFGSYELFTARNDLDTLQRLLEYTLSWHFPDLVGTRDERYAAWLETIAVRTAEMIVHWMRVGFVHGVMNTDNMSILGLTIDYGPYGWLEGYDPLWTPNTTDAGGRRYAYGQQPEIAAWNLERLARAIAPLVTDHTKLDRALSRYAETVADGQRQMMADKLGLQTARDDDDQLVRDLLGVLELIETDMTIFFRRLADLPSTGPMAPHHMADAYYNPSDVTEAVRDRTAAWLDRYIARVREDGRPDDERRRSMNAVNPKYVLRNYLAQLAIDDAERGDPSRIAELLEVLRHPYDGQPKHEGYAGKRPEWARHRAGCSMLSCSS